MSITAKQKKIIVDVVTVLLLIGAFGLAYYTGLVGRKESGDMMLELNIFAVISVVGSLVLLAVGGVSEMLSRIKSNTVTWSFTAFMAVQVFAFIGMCAIVIGLKSGAFPVESWWIRGLFLCFVAVLVLGYIQAVVYSNALEGDDSDVADADDDEDYDDDDFDEEDDTDDSDEDEDTDEDDSED